MKKSQTLWDNTVFDTLLKKWNKLIHIGNSLIAWFHTSESLPTSYDFHSNSNSDSVNGQVKWNDSSVRLSSWYYRGLDDLAKILFFHLF